MKNHEDGIIVGRHSLLRYDVQIPGRAWPWDGVGTLGPQNFEIGETVKIGFLQGNPQLAFIVTQKPWPISYRRPFPVVEEVYAHWGHFLAVPSRASSLPVGPFPDPLESAYRRSVVASGSQNHWPVVRCHETNVYSAKRTGGMDLLGRYNAAGELTASYAAGGGIVEMVLTDHHCYLVERTGGAAHNFPYLGAWWSAGSVNALAAVSSRVVCLDLDLQVVWAGDWFNDGVVLGEPSLALTSSQLIALAVVQVGRCLHLHQMMFALGNGERTSVVRLAYKDPPQPVLQPDTYGPTASPSDSTPRRGIGGSIDLGQYTNGNHPNFTFLPRMGRLDEGVLHTPAPTWGALCWHEHDPLPNEPQDFSRGHENWIVSAGVHVPTGARRQVCGFDLETGARLWHLSESAGNVACLYYPILASGNKLLLRKEIVTHDEAGFVRWTDQADFVADNPPSLETRWSFVSDVAVKYQVRDIKTGALIRERSLGTERITSLETVPNGPCARDAVGPAHYYTTGPGLTPPAIGGGSTAGLQARDNFALRAFTPTGSSTAGRLPWIVHGTAYSSHRNTSTGGTAVRCPARVAAITKDAPLIHAKTRASVSLDGEHILFEPQRLPAPANRAIGFSIIPSNVPSHLWLGSEYYYYEGNWVVCYDWELNETWRYGLRAADSASLGCWSTNIVCSTENRASLIYCTATSNEAAANSQKCELVELDIATGMATQVRPYWAFSQIGPAKSIYLDQQTLWATKSALITRDTAQTGLIALNKES